MYHFDEHLDPKQRLCAISNNGKHYFALRSNSDVPLCKHYFTKECLIKWIGTHADKKHSTLCPNCLIIDKSFTIGNNNRNNEKNGKPIVILTVPHSNCKWANPNDERTHKCDFSAMRMAISLRKSLEKKGFEVVSFPSEDSPENEKAKWRPDYDENRPYGGYFDPQSDSSMRTQFKEFFRSKENKNRIILALDVHSYPDEFCYASQQRIWFQKEPDCIGIYDFFVLDNTPASSQELKFSNLTQQFVKQSIELGVEKLVWREGSRSENYIQTFFRENGIPSFLLETNERLDDNSLDYASTRFAQAISEIFG